MTAGTDKQYKPKVYRNGKTYAQNVADGTFQPIGALKFQNEIKSEVAELKDKRLRGCTTPNLFVCSSAPQFPLKPFLNPSSTVRFENISFSLFKIRFLKSIP